MGSYSHTDRAGSAQKCAIEAAAWRRHAELEAAGQGVIAPAGVATAPGAGALQRLDWSAPWLSPYRPLGQALSADLARGASVAEALNAALPTCGIALDAGPLRFVPQAALPESEAYETFIYRSACVPTRDNLHDLLGGLVWLQWPQLKRRLNALHSEAVRQA
ncbi:DUF3025 domain-containing protein, partial [Roseateles sp. GG27B]